MSYKSGDWFKENIRLSETEAADREYLRVRTESPGDSEVLRQALRNFEQLVEDESKGRFLLAIRPDNNRLAVQVSLFRDPQMAARHMVRRSLILHRNSKIRLDAIRDRLNLSDVSEVARYALRFFAFLARENDNGSRFFMRNKEGSETEVRFGVFSQQDVKVEENETDGNGPHLPKVAKVRRVGEPTFS